MRVLGTIGNQGDKILVMPLLGAAILGNYSLGLQVLVVCNSISTIICIVIVFDRNAIMTDKVVKLVADQPH